MNTPFDFQEPGKGIVYVKPVQVADLPEALKAEAGELELIYAVHDSDGHQLALVADRKLAFMLARQHDYAPVNVH
ncbi:DUF1150 family protein [Seohaeicola nanhaiensis]|uniref:DUF1150 family protein n=1 Tax=Seohaeicola nanhaiensis TaxID=1387282 RepID=A0ABV9KML4_9RHOB